MSDEYICKADAIKQCGFGMTSLHIANNLRGMRPADVVPVVHGKWIHDGHHRRCNKCGTYFCNADREGDVIPDNFCPNCGAKMDAQGEV